MTSRLAKTEDASETAAFQPKIVMYQPEIAKFWYIQLAFLAQQQVPLQYMHTVQCPLRSPLQCTRVGEVHLSVNASWRKSTATGPPRAHLQGQKTSGEDATQQMLLCTRLYAASPAWLSRAMQREEPERPPNRVRKPRSTGAPLIKQTSFGCGLSFIPHMPVQIQWSVGRSTR